MTSILPLRLENVNFMAGDKRLIKDVNLEIKAGSRVVILGANGAGKSLLLRLCHGLVEPHSGLILWNDRPITDPDVRKSQAMVFQRPVMLRRTALDNIDFVLKNKGYSKSERQDRAYQALKQVGLGRLALQPARVLSGGEQQRLAMARCWAMHPEVLILDEPSSSLDPSATHYIEETIQAFINKGTTIIMTTHDLGQAKRIADHVIFMHRGRVLEYAQADQFFEQPQNDLAQAFMRGDLLWWKKKKPYPGGGVDKSLEI